MAARSLLAGVNPLWIGWALVVLCYGRMLWSGYTGADQSAILLNPDVTDSVFPAALLHHRADGHPLQPLWTGARWDFRPVQTIAHRLVFALSGVQPIGWHAANMAAHLWTVSAVGRLVPALVASPSPSPTRSQSQQQSVLCVLASVVVAAVHPAASTAVTGAAHLGVVMGVACALEAVVAAVGGRSAARSVLWWLMAAACSDAGGMMAAGGLMAAALMPNPTESTPTAAAAQARGADKQARRSPRSLSVLSVTAVVGLAVLVLAGRHAVAVVAGHGAEHEGDAVVDQLLGEQLAAEVHDSHGAPPVQVNHGVRVGGVRGRVVALSRVVRALFVPFVGADLLAYDHYGCVHATAASTTGLWVAVGAVVGVVAAVSGAVPSQRARLVLGCWLTVAWLPWSHLLWPAGEMVPEAMLYGPAMVLAVAVGLCVGAGSSGKGGGKGKKKQAAMSSGSGSTVLVFYGVLGVAALMAVQTMSRHDMLFNQRTLGEQALQMCPRSPQVLLDRSISLGRMGEKYYEDALYEAEQSVRAEPTFAHGWHMLGELTLRSGGDELEAADWFQKAVDHGFDQAGESLSRLGVMAVRAGNTRQGFYRFADALRFDPHSFKYAFNLGNSLHHESELGAAERAFRYALKLQPNVRTYLGLANVLAQNGRMEEALEAINGALAIEPDNEDAVNMRDTALEDMLSESEENESGKEE